MTGILAVVGIDLSVVGTDFCEVGIDLCFVGTDLSVVGTDFCEVENGPRLFWLHRVSLVVNDFFLMVSCLFEVVISHILMTLICPCAGNVLF